MGHEVKSNGEPKKASEQGRGAIRFAFEEICRVRPGGARPGSRSTGVRAQDQAAPAGAHPPATSPAGEEGERGGGTWQPNARQLMSPGRCWLFLAAAPADPRSRSGGLPPGCHGNAPCWELGPSSQPPSPAPWSPDEGAAPAGEDPVCSPAPVLYDLGAPRPLWESWRGRGSVRALEAQPLVGIPAGPAARGRPQCHPGSPWSPGLSSLNGSDLAPGISATH